MTIVDMNRQEEFLAHRKTFIGFERLVLFAAIHVALILVCLAMAFVGHMPTLAVILGVGGTLALIIFFAVSAPRS
jgi:hypothetical protein